MTYPYSITTRSDGEIITHTKYNADHQNHIDNNIPSSIDDYAADLATFRLQTSPGGVGTESLPGSLAGELERLRYILASIKGTTYWYSQAGSLSILKGLRGSNNAATPTTKYDFNSPMIIAGNLTSGPMVDLNNSQFTVDITQAGPVANGRDQAGVFSANSWVRIYAIYGIGVSPACIASAVSPTGGGPGPVLPSGYTHWAYITTLRLNASTQFIRTRLSSSWVMYDIDSASAPVQVLNLGQATTFTDVNMSAVISPESSSCQLNAYMLLTHTSAGVFIGFLRPNDATHMTNGIYAGVAVSQLPGVQTAALNWLTIPIGSDGILEYRISNVPATAGGLTLEVIGYRVPNGAE